MGAGRKTTTVTLKEKARYTSTVNGLPASHFSYVKNINVGLTLFLFNYSDRKLHGIFEAASPGKLNINPYGWTSDGTENTPYAAQDKGYCDNDINTRQGQGYSDDIDTDNAEGYCDNDIDTQQGRRIQ
ncbi:hypothetical protein T459_16370 [Capsicum annuum]|uniref:DCD domain-containing protein n=1 Tax=Capsicum annuum TaxID=4072 RepID=A0A2G2Z8J1_CAPAN|nr:hypothetical protein T459_16370 [Capsicum annuum]